MMFLAVHISQFIGFARASNRDADFMLSNIVKRYMRDPVKTYFGLLKIQVKF